MVKKITYQLILLLTVLSVQAQELKIGMFTTSKPTQLLLSVGAGAYVLKIDSIEKGVIQPGTPIYVSHGENQLWIKAGDLLLGPVPSFSLLPAVEHAFIKVLCQTPLSKEQWYEGGVVAKAKQTGIQLINNIDIERYIGGVVEAETGSEQVKEFYKVQACITRTFALANQKKHMAEDYNLCDQVHCQVYRGKPHSNPAIVQAVGETEGLILVDRKLQLIDAVFHANCGGQTHNSEDYWMDTISYLRSIKDPYCSEGIQANWKINLPKDKWLRYLYGNFNCPIDNSDFVQAACNYEPVIRKQYFLDDHYKIGLRRLRSDWNFRSTFFATKEDSDVVQFIGKGFGHGVGLCQEGAMKMAKLKMSFSDILHYYFTDVFVLPKNDLFYLKSY